MAQPRFYRILGMERVESKSPTNWVQRLLLANAEQQRYSPLAAGLAIQAQLLPIRVVPTLFIPPSHDLQVDRSSATLVALVSRLWLTRS